MNVAAERLNGLPACTLPQIVILIPTVYSVKMKYFLVVNNVSPYV